MESTKNPATMVEFASVAAIPQKGNRGASFEESVGKYRVFEEAMKRGREKREASIAESFEKKCVLEEAMKKSSEIKKKAEEDDVKPLKREAAAGNGSAANKRKAEGEKFTVFIDGLRKNSEKKDMELALREHFEACGRIARIDVMLGVDGLAGYAYIDFTNIDSHTKAQELDNTVNTAIGDDRIRVHQVLPRYGGEDESFFYQGVRAFKFMPHMSKLGIKGMWLPVRMY